MLQFARFYIDFLDIFSFRTIHKISVIFLIGYFEYIS